AGCHSQRAAEASVRPTRGVPARGAAAPGAFGADRRADQRTPVDARLSPFLSRLRADPAVGVTQPARRCPVPGLSGCRAGSAGPRHRPAARPGSDRGRTPATPQAGPADLQWPIATPARASRLPGGAPPGPVVPAAPRPDAPAGADGTFPRLKPAMPSRTVVTRSEAATRVAGEELAPTLRAGDIVLLVGDLGMGKTVFARGVAAGLGVDPQQVRSPSFTLINRYAGQLTVYHIDLYRVDCVEDLDELGLDEVLEGDGVAVVEWAERLGPYRPRRFIEVRLTDRGG